MTKRLILPMIVLAVFALFLGACKKTETNETTGTSATSMTDTSAAAATDTTNTSTSTTTTGTTGTTGTSTTAANLSDDDKKFVEKAAQGGMAEVAFGQDMSSRGTNADVKAFAQRMVTDHGAANNELQQLASSKGITLPSDMGKEHQEHKAKLDKLNGAKLDKEYMEMMVKDHEKDVDEFKKASKDSKDPDLKAWAAKTLPTLEAHLKQAKDTNAKLK